MRQIGYYFITIIRVNVYDFKLSIILCTMVCSIKPKIKTVYVCVFAQERQEGGRGGGGEGRNSFVLFIAVSTNKTVQLLL